MVTGAAGFIGSALAERLLQDGHHVVLLDSFTDFYDPAIKRDRVAAILRAHPDAVLLERDLCSTDSVVPLGDIEVVFHLAGQPGVRSWGPGFREQLNRNVLATQLLLEAAAGVDLHRFVFASSSSIYGNVEAAATREESVAEPVSPYGVTKLACEQLVHAYRQAWPFRTVILRYFTVYGPGQRPDMAFHRFIRAIQENRGIEVFGDGDQLRDFTFISDAVSATASAATSEGATGHTINVGGGRPCSINECIKILAEIAGHEVEVRYLPPQLGDVRQTSADISRAERELGYIPSVSLEEGLRREWDWLASHRSQRAIG
jgi:nucleoside-diphosphate-sugar epimerase